MAHWFCLSVRFLDSSPEFHGKEDGGLPEWPPSPLRAFQALVAAMANEWPRGQAEGPSRESLEWLERKPPPDILAPACCMGAARRIAVPNNDMDSIATAWSRGQESRKQASELKTLKSVQPTRLLVKESDTPTLYYLWRLDESGRDSGNHMDVLIKAARTVTHLGWGVDMVAANASIVTQTQADKLPGERWQPTDDSSAKGYYRVPIEGNLAALIQRHEAFLSRIGPADSFYPVPALPAFRAVGYRRAMDPPTPSFATFSILRPDASDYQPFDTVRRGLCVAGMIRHAASSNEIARALGWPPEKVAQFVLGHGEALGESHAPVTGPRLAFIPLPSIQRRGHGPPQVVTSIRRAMITVMGGSAGDDLQRLARVLSGSDLIREDNGERMAMLSLIPTRSDTVVPLYTRPSTIWATVTPVILPGYDDPRKWRRRLFRGPESGSQALDPGEQKELLIRLERRTEFLLRKAIVQAGYSRELAQQAIIEWRTVGFWPGTEPATRYPFPNETRRHRRLHVRIAWRDTTGQSIALPGPICLGGGRFYGLGLFAGLDSHGSR